MTIDFQDQSEFDIVIVLILGLAVSSCYETEYDYSNDGYNNNRILLYII
jgi:hypothetical protein